MVELFSIQLGYMSALVNSPCLVIYVGTSSVNDDGGVSDE